MKKGKLKMAKEKGVSENVNPITIPKGLKIIGVKVWQPAQGDTLHGYFIGTKKRKSHAKGKDGKTEFTSYEIAQKDTGECFAISGSALEQRFAEIKIGAEVFLIYNGKRKSDKGRLYHDFDVYAGSAKA
jgi:hypothetical protein